MKKTQSSKNVQNKVGFFSSIKVKIVAAIVVALIVNVVLVMAICIPTSKSTISSLVQNYMNDMAKTAGIIGATELEYSKL